MRALSSWEDFSFDKAEDEGNGRGVEVASGCFKKSSLPRLEERRQRAEVRPQYSNHVLEAAKASTYEIVDSAVLVIRRSAVDVLQKTFTN